MNRSEVANRLAMITGRSVSEFFNGEINDNADTHGRRDNETHDVLDASETGTDTDHVDDDEISGDNVQPETQHVISLDNVDEDKEHEPSAEELKILEDLAKQYDGVVVNKRVMDNKITMTRADYLKISKNLTQTELCNHPLMYIMFRSEGQGTASFIEWTARFEK